MIKITSGVGQTAKETVKYFIYYYVFSELLLDRPSSSGIHSDDNIQKTSTKRYFGYSKSCTCTQDDASRYNWCQV